MLNVQERAVKSKVREFKIDVEQLEKDVKRWEQEIRIRKIGESSEHCYEAFNELQMSLAKLKDLKARDKFQLDCYKETYNFLAFCENDVNVDFYVLILNNCPPFARLIEHYSNYCANAERQYGIELDSEKKIRVDQNLLEKVRSRFANR